MSDIYKLAVSEEELSGGDPYASLEFNPINPTRDPSGDSFAQGTLFFKWEIGSNQWWDPKRTFVQCDVSLTKSDGTTPLVLADGVAPAMGSPSCLFDRVEFLLDNKTIEVIETGSLQATETFTKRSEKSGYYLANGEGNSNANWNAQFAQRQSLYASDGTAQYVPNISGQSLIWHLPLSVFQHCKTYLPVGKYELRLVPSSNFQKQFVQSASADKVPNTDYKVTVNDVQLFVPTVIGKRLSDLTYLIDVIKYNVQKREVANNASLQKQTFQVPANTFKVGVAFQNKNAGQNTQYPLTSFTLVPQATVAKTELHCSKLFIQYKNQQKPASQLDQEYASGGFYGFGYRYNYSNETSHNEDPESVVDYSTRGPMLMANFSADSSDKATTLTVYFQFESGFTPVDGNLLLFTCARSVSKVKVENNMVVAVESEDH